MSDFRRYFAPGGTYFFTIVTYRRRPILTTGAGRKHLRNAIAKIREKRPFNIFATVLLPDHWHLVMQLPRGDDNFSTRIKRIKEEFSKSWFADGLLEAPVTVAQQKRGERGIWQPRFWEHCVADEDDLIRCVDYIHWNPRKHELVTRVRDWEWSSFHRFVKSGDYEIDWGGTEPESLANQLGVDWGE
jgi:putative transposase